MCTALLKCIQSAAIGVICSPVFLPLCTAGANRELNEKQVDELVRCYAFVQGQNISLSRVTLEFPELRTQADTASYEFNASALGLGAKGVADTLKEFLGNRWAAFDEKLLKDAEEELNKNAVDKKAAVKFLETVVNRSQGRDLPKSVLRTLLANNNAFRKNPALELADGWKEAFSSRGHPKSEDIALTLDLPASWNKREGRQPHIVQKFQNEDGHGPVLMTVGVFPLDPKFAKLSQAEVRQALSKGEIVQFLPPKSTVLSYQEVVLGAGVPASLVILEQEQQVLETKQRMLSTNFMTIADGSLINLQFMIGDQMSGGKSLADLQVLYLPTFKAIANTLQLDAASQSHSAESPTSGSGVVISNDGLILTAKHVLAGGRSLRVKTASGAYDAELVASDETLDVALLKAHIPEAAPAVIGSSTDVKLAQKVFTIGFPNVDVQGVSAKVTTGEISSLNGLKDEHERWQISVPVQPGNSGGALFDMRGNVIGLLVATLDSSAMLEATGQAPQNVNYAVKSDYILTFLRDNSVKPSNGKPSQLLSASDELEKVVERVKSSAVIVLSE